MYDNETTSPGIRTDKANTHLMVSDHCRSQLCETPEELQVQCWPLKWSHFLKVPGRKVSHSTVVACGRKYKSSSKKLYFIKG